MKCAAPGKLVVAGAYAVLAGTPALVVAVDRYAVATLGEPPPLVTEEVRAAMAAGLLDTAPGFDASALRQRDADGADRKLGLGSSAAILVASAGAVALAGGASPDHLAQQLFAPCLAAHRKAQGGGSGVDVAASCFGGALVCTLDDEGALSVTPHKLPDGLVVEVFASDKSASTASMIASVRALEARDEALHARCFAAIAEAAAATIGASTPEAFTVAIRAHGDALAKLGDAAAIPIVPAPARALADRATEEGAAFMPSGAGGGDVAIHVAPRPASEAFVAAAAQQGMVRVAMRVGARGVHPVAA